ncbi:MAG: circularly permuted type 2 ATP-grasp protein [Planctomycetaceae bacterium]
MSQSQTQALPLSLFATYSPPAGVYDEAVFGIGKPRAEWKTMVDRLDAMGEAELRTRWLQAQAQIERDGVTFNPHDDDGQVSRPWTLDAIPMVLSDVEWDGLSERLIQRARVLEALLGDLFGDQILLKEKIIPPDLLFGHPAWYPAYQNLYSSSQRYLTYCVTDLARAPDGKWWATGDRTRSPFGLGYVLENRIVTSRMLSSVFRQLPVRRLARFYATLKEQLRQLAPRFKDNPRIVMWTKGPQSRSYFEDSYLARYLGYTLAEGDDLAVRDNRVQLLTLGGLLPVEVLLRRLDDDDCDSVELNPKSAIGISSLLEVLRSGRVSVANAMGSRLAESPIFLPFLPAVARRLLNEDLQMPSVATWWCGEKKARTYVLQNLERMQIRPAYRMTDDAPIRCLALSAKQREELIDRINASPGQFVGQETLARSTTPVLTDSGVVPWYVGLRTYVVANGDGYQTLPGGLARVSADSDSLNATMTAGERSQDVWILTNQEVDHTSLLEASSTPLEPRRSGSELPSRVADNFFWLGRYVERAEQTARLLQTLFNSLESEDTNGPENTPLLRFMADQGQVDPDLAVPELRRTFADAVGTLPAAMLDPERTMSLRSSVNSAVRTTMRVRDRISLDMWRAIDRLNSQFRLASQSSVKSVDASAVLENTLSSLSSFAGLIDEGMTRTLGWRFLDLGRRLERSWQTAAMLRSFFCGHPSDDPETLEALLTVTGSLMTYRNRYLSTFQVPVVLDLLMTDTSNPRSIIYQLIRINEHLDAMPGNESRALLNPEQKLGMSLSNSVRLLDIYEVSERDRYGNRPQLQKLLTRLDEHLPRLSDAVSSRFLIHAGLPRHFGSSTEVIRSAYGPD